MSIFRVEKSKNYTVMSNYHLRDKNLSLKTIGLLSLILSLPENWDYSQAGLAAICKDGEDSIRSGLKELEKYGYLERERERDENGRMRGTIYHIYETPKNKRIPEMENPTMELPIVEIPTLENPILVNSTLENPIQDNPSQATPKQAKQGQINKDIITTEEENTKVRNIDQSIYPSNDKKMNDRKMGDVDTERTSLKERIKINISYDFFEHKFNNLEEKLENGLIDLVEYEEQTNSYNLSTIDKVISYMLDVILSRNNSPVQIGDDLIDRDVVKEKLMQTNMLQMKQVVYALNTTTIKNPKKYAISMLYNA